MPTYHSSGRRGAPGGTSTDQHSFEVVDFRVNNLILRDQAELLVGEILEVIIP